MLLRCSLCYFVHNLWALCFTDLICLLSGALCGCAKYCLLWASWVDDSCRRRYRLVIQVHSRPGVSNKRSVGRNWPSKVSNLAHWKALKNLKKCIDFELLTLFSSVLQVGSQWATRTFFCNVTHYYEENRKCTIKLTFLYIKDISVIKSSVKCTFLVWPT